MRRLFKTTALVGSCEAEIIVGTVAVKVGFQDSSQVVV
jgi:hypothetical protein